LISGRELCGIGDSRAGISGCGHRCGRGCPWIDLGRECWTCGFVDFGEWELGRVGIQAQFSSVWMRQVQAGGVQLSSAQFS